MTWHTLETAREEWEDAPSSDRRLTVLLENAKLKVIAYAGRRLEHLQDTNVAPLMEAQLRVAINLWNDEQADTTIVDSDFPTTRRFLEWKKLIRPQRGVPRVR
jgi:hypothetical protein